MTKFYKRPEFLQLQNEWYAKLKEEGFVDIETYPTENFKQTRFVKNSIYHTQKSLSYDKQEYFRLASIYLNHGTFENSIDKYLWGLHCEGETVINISKRLKKDTGIYVCKTMVHNRIVRIAKRMLETDEDTLG